MKLKFHVLLLRIMSYVIRRLDLSRSKFISRRDNIKLWEISEKIEGIANRIENEYKDYTWNEEGWYEHNNTIISGTIKAKR